MWVVVLQIALLFAWHAVPWLVAVPWWLIWMPSMVWATLFLLELVLRRLDRRDHAAGEWEGYEDD